MARLSTTTTYSKHAWVPATLLKTEGDKATVEVPVYKDEQAMICDGGRSAKEKDQRVVKLKDYPNKVLPLQNIDGNNNMPEYADMVMLPYLHEVRSENGAGECTRFVLGTTKNFANVYPKPLFPPNRPPFCTT